MNGTYCSRLDGTCMAAPLGRGAAAHPATGVARRSVIWGALLARREN